MKVTKRVFALVVAVVMLVSVFSVAASALTYTPTLTGGTYKFSLVPDKYEVNPGDTVTFNVYIDDAGLESDFSSWMVILLYNDGQLSPSSTDGPTFRQYMNDATTFLKQTSTVNYNMALTPINRFLTEDEKAYYNHAIMMNGVVDTSLGVAAIPGQGWDPSGPDVSMLQFQMVVSEDVQPGDEIWFGMHDSYYQSNTAYLSNCPANRIPNANLDLTNGMVKLTVAEPAAAGPVVEKSKAELKFTLTSATTVADDYLFRVTSKVSDADWDAYFANTGTADATTNAIQALGFVAYKGTEGFSMDTAKAVAQGTPAEGYYNATTDYVQKESDTSDALFGAIIDTSKDTDADATYVAYIQYLDAEGQTAYAFYETAQTALLEQNYETYVQQYVNTYGGSFAA